MNQRAVDPTPVKGKFMPAQRKNPISRKKKTDSKCQRLVRTISPTISAVR
jgi:hypothetical protein